MKIAINPVLSRRQNINSPHRMSLDMDELCTWLLFLGMPLQWPDEVYAGCCDGPAGGGSPVPFLMSPVAGDSSKYLLLPVPAPGPARQ